MFEEQSAVIGKAVSALLKVKFPRFFAVHRRRARRKVSPREKRLEGTDSGGQRPRRPGGLSMWPSPLPKGQGHTTVPKKQV